LRIRAIPFLLPLVLKQLVYTIRLPILLLLYCCRFRC
jgi:hypothetical protein